MKKPIIGFTVAVVVLASLAFIARTWLVDSSKAPSFAMSSSTNAETGIGPSLNSQQAPTNIAEPPTPVITGTDSPLLPLEPSNVDAATSMANAMKNGDPRAPTIIHDTVQEAATPEEIADPKLYAQYEARQNMRLYKGYVKAAEVEIPRLQADIAKAKAMGLKPEQIAEGEEKLRRIQQMRDQLASEHPEVLRQ
jgi:hypothetical protein